MLIDDLVFYPATIVIRTSPQDVYDWLEENLEDGSWYYVSTHNYPESSNVGLEFEFDTEEGRLMFLLRWA